MRLTRLITRRFGKERAALYDAELEHLVKKGYSEKEVSNLLETNAFPIGIFDILSMLTRSQLSVKDLEKSLFFLFNRHTIIRETLSKLLKPNSRILDVGCGRGLLTCSLALEGYEVHGVDMSADAIEIGKKLAEKLGCKPTFHLIKENEFPLPAAYFDAAVCVWTLHEVSQDQIPKLLAEVGRTLRKSCTAFIIDQEGVTPFENIKNIMDQQGFKLIFEKSLSPVYDHGRTSKAIMMKYVKRDLKR
jgi:ubiquinone/menaquinone biosynthesis C-methylase UbiE